MVESLAAGLTNTVLRIFTKRLAWRPRSGPHLVASPLAPFSHFFWIGSAVAGRTDASFECGGANCAAWRIIDGSLTGARHNRRQAILCQIRRE